MVLILLYIIHIIISLFLIAVVLLQQGKGADLSVFGGGGTMTAFGARGAATLLHKMTVTSFILFIVTTMAIGAIQRSGEEGTVMSGVPVEEGAVASGETDDDSGLGTEGIDAGGEPLLEEEGGLFDETLDETGDAIDEAGDVIDEAEDVVDPNDG